MNIWYMGDHEKMRSDDPGYVSATDFLEFLRDQRFRADLGRPETRDVGFTWENSVQMAKSEERDRQQ